MPLEPSTPITYLITSGETKSANTPASPEFRRLLSLVSAAVAAHVRLIQLREKNLHARTLYELAARSAIITRGTPTRLLVNDRADIARAAGADGVHLTNRSLDPSIIRRAFGDDFLIGVSTHSPEEARAAGASGADFAVFGPVFDTPSKRAYGAPLGLAALRETARSVTPFPLVAIGGITLHNAREALDAGARGVAAIRMFASAEKLAETVREIENGPHGIRHER